MKILILIIVCTAIFGCAFCKASAQREDAEIFAIVNGIAYKTFESCASNEECLEAYEDAHGVIADTEGMARD